MTSYIFNDVSTNWIITANTIQPKTGETLIINGDLSGNVKTYIDNFGGTGGWYYTTTVSVTLGKTFAFPNCLNNNYNAYEIYFVPNITNSSGYINIQMTITGINVPVYATWSTALSTASTPTYVNSHQTVAPYIQTSMNYSVILNRQTNLKVELWGTRNISGGVGSSKLSYSSEGYTSENPGLTGWIKTMGTINYSSGTATGITLTYAGATPDTYTGSVSIYVKSKY